MRDSFSLLLVHEKYDKYFRQLKAMHIMAVLFLVVYAAFLLYNVANNILRLVGIGTVLFSILSIVFFRSALLKKVLFNQMIRMIEILLLGAAAFHFYKLQYKLPMSLFILVALILLLLLLLENKILGKQYIVLNQKEIVFPNLFTKRSIPWQNIKNVVLKFSVLTVEMKDESFLQQSVREDFSEEELSSFNQFIKERLV